ncbi:MAG: hypothetical protein GY862_05960, partial [Gammaproteobacteria bacterium]|nr:hypothetical protein [Gammaproteobacteria bacterium]
MFACIAGMLLMAVPMNTYAADQPRDTSAINIGTCEPGSPTCTATDTDEDVCAQMDPPSPPCPPYDPDEISMEYPDFGQTKGDNPDAISTASSITALDTSLVINEVDYDQGGTDSGEFIEIKNVSSGMVDLRAYTVQLIDSTDTSVYRTISLSGGLVAGDYYVICADDTKVLHCDLDVPPDTDFIRDGAPNAISLIKGTSILDTVSYEGNTPNGYTETSGAPVDNGDTALTGLSRYPDGTDSNDNGNDFSLRCVTPGGANNIADSGACFELTINDGTVIEGNSGTVSAAFTISLSHAATSEVTVNVVTADNTAAAGSDYTALVSVPITFPANDKTAQTIEVTINGDEIDENVGETFYVQLNDISANAVIADNQQGVGTITDDDIAGIAVHPVADLMLITSESGDQAAFTVVLESEPVADVYIALSSSNTNEGTVAGPIFPSKLVFTSGNWYTPQTVTVTGVDDFPPVADGNITYTVVTVAAVSGDGNYNGLNPDNISVINNDNDVQGITIIPVSDLITTETGDKATFTVKLDTQPSVTVTLDLSSNKPGEGTVSPAFLIFTQENWNTPQMVTVTGMDDSTPVVDGDSAYTIIITPVTSTDKNYSELDPVDVLLTNNDNDVPGFTIITPVNGLFTTEAGGTATFSVKLNTLPSDNVTLFLSSSEPAEGTVISPVPLIFTPGDWNTLQTVTVTGVDDSPPVVDGNIPYTIVTKVDSGEDGDYNGLNPDDISLTNNDNDAPGFTISPVSDLITTEAGGEATFTVMLNSKPSANVFLSLSSSEPGEGTVVSPASLIFTPGDWNMLQTVTVTGVDDSTPIVDGDIAYTIITAPVTSADDNYNWLDPVDVLLTNNDNDIPRFIISPVTGLITTESGGTATFSVKLNTLPSNDVTLSLSSSEPGKGTVSPVSMMFTADNWNVAQLVTATGVDDSPPVADGNAAYYTIVTAAATSMDDNYNGLNPDDISVANSDNDAPGFAISPVSGLITTEAGDKATFSVMLNTLPFASITLPLISSKLGEGTVSPASLIFTADNWNVAQTVTVTGVDDSPPVADGNIAYTIVTAAVASGDGDYNGINPDDVSVINNDNDVPGFTINPVNGLITTEAGDKATFTVMLNTRPSAGVTLLLSSNELGEGTVSPASLSFTADNWNITQTVTVTGIDDSPPAADGDTAYTIVTAATASLDDEYSVLNPADVSLTNKDNDAPGFTITPVSGLITTEAGSKATFTVTLNTQPSAGVTLPLSSNKLGEGTVSPASLSFTADNWNVVQTVTVTGVDDSPPVVDGDTAYTVVTAAAASLDDEYSVLNPADVSLINKDNDTPGFTISPVSGLITTEVGGKATFTVTLNTRPSAGVTLPLSSNNHDEGVVNSASLTFTADNWNIAQTVTVTGVNDSPPVADGNIAYTVIMAAAASEDGNYNGLEPDDVLLTNKDNDAPGFTISPVSGLITTEAGGTATFTVTLNTRPSAGVTLPLRSSEPGEGTVSPASLIFIADNWNIAQTVTVTGVDDNVDDDDMAYTVTTNNPNSDDSNYNGADANPVDVSVTNKNEPPPVGLVEIRFLDTRDFYYIGDTVGIRVSETRTRKSRSESVDLWLAMRTPDGEFFFKPPASVFSLEPQAFKTGIAPSETEHPVPELAWPFIEKGEYALYALYVQEGADPLTK